MASPLRGVAAASALKRRAASSASPSASIRFMAASDRSALDDPAIECTTPALEDDIDCPAPTNGRLPDADEVAPTFPMYPPRLGPFDSEAADASLMEPVAKLILPSSSPLAAA